MRKSSRTRGYLQQLAQPVAPGQAVLTGSAGARTSVAEYRPVVPVIENHFETRPADALPAIEALERAVAMAKPPASRATRRAAVTTSANEKNAWREKQAIPASSDRTAREMPLGAWPRASALSRSEDRAELRAAANDLVVEAKDADHVGVPQLLRAEDGVRLPAESLEAARKSAQAEAGRAKQSRAAADAPPITPREHSEERPTIQTPSETALVNRAPKQRQSQEPRADAGTHVHIGTLEIRMALPQAPAPQVAPAPSRPQENAAAQARGRAGNAEPLARGLAWTYGLVQG